MSTMVFHGNTTFEEVFHKNALAIYEAVLEKIKKNIHARSKEIIRIATIRLNNLEYNIDIPASNFCDVLQRASQVFKEYNKPNKSVECLELLKEMR
ncbi:MAG: hypothetical protein R2809_02825 [Flavobacteriales bacterium]